jgi:benzoyl-CoA 2,3-dioxygenase component B
VGIYEGHPTDIHGTPISEVEFESKRAEWLPTAADYEYVNSCMVCVTEPGKFANWIAPPRTGINEQPVEFEYVRLN